MGDPKRIRKKYETPRHPWIGSRIKEERTLMRDYGLVNKKEIWKMGTMLKGFKDRAKALLAQTGRQADKEREELISRMARLGLIKQGATFDDILGLDVKGVLDRRLQTLMLKKHLARTPRQARQMITHRHVLVGNRVITSPGYLVTVDEEGAIAFANRSAFVSEQHPERFSEEELAKQRAKDAKQKKGEEGAEEVLAFDEKEIEKAEVLAGEKKVSKPEDVESPEAPTEEKPGEAKSESSPASKGETKSASSESASEPEAKSEEVAEQPKEGAQ